MKRNCNCKPLSTPICLPASKLQARARHNSESFGTGVVAVAVGIILSTTSWIIWEISQKYFHLARIKMYFLFRVAQKKIFRA